MLFSPRMRKTFLVKEKGEVDFFCWRRFTADAFFSLPSTTAEIIDYEKRMGAASREIENIESPPTMKVMASSVAKSAH
jgi:hypothetical protein